MKKGKDYLSLNARLYRDFYDVNVMPPGLCAYSWKSLIMYLLIIPFTLFSFPMFFIYALKVIFTKGKELTFSNGERLGFSLFIYILIGGIYCATISILSLCNKIHGNINIIQIGWSFIALVLFIVGLAVYTEYIEGNATVLGDVIKTKFEGICPRIEWQNLPDWQKEKRLPDFDINVPTPSKDNGTK